MVFQFPAQCCVTEDLKWRLSKQETTQSMSSCLGPEMSPYRAPKDVEKPSVPAWTEDALGEWAERPSALMPLI